MDITSDVPQLLRCPFCGGAAEFHEKDQKHEEGGVFSAVHSCGCFNCGIVFTRKSKFTVTGSKVKYIEDGYQHVLNSWNHRYTSM